MLQQLKTLFFGNSRGERAVYEKLRKQFAHDSQELIFAGHILQSAYQRFADRVALIAGDKSVTYKEFYFRSLLMSKKLAQLGVGQRDHVVLYFENSVEFYIAYFAVWQLGAVVIPLNIFFHAKELAHVMSEAQPKIILASLELKKNIDQACEQGLISALPTVLTEQDFDWSTPVPVAIEPNDQAVVVAGGDRHECCLILYTSGTTGKPKGVMLSSKNVVTNALQSFARFKMCFESNEKEQERFLSVLPLFHVFAQNTCLWFPILSGSAIIIVSKIDRKLILEGLQKRPTLFFGFPALYGLLCLMRTAPLDTVKLFVSGADMMPDKIRAAFGMIYGRKICSGYGLTEASPVVAINYHNEERSTDVVGKPIVGIESQIRDEQGNVLAAGNVGTLWIRGDNIMLGYYKEPEATARVLQDGWLNTGDLACIDAYGELAITGRSKDLIIHKGFNIYPQEVENILMTHPLVIKAAVVGREEVMSGQIPVAYVAVRQMSGELERSLRELCINNLAAYKVPRKFICLDDLPMSPTGKIDKKQLSNLN
ncbi:AMP-binding protein [Candidatus Babeliales bacterium]|nr:AMP-binding protein [Candidatus Babeliales bacterium]